MENMDITMIISSFITCSVSIIISFDFMNNMFLKSYNRSYTPFMIIMISLLFIINSFQNTYLNYIGTAFYFFILSHTLYFSEKKTSKIYFITFLFVLFLIGIEIITTILIQTIFMKNGIKDYQYLVGSIGSTIITLLMYKVLIRILKKEETKSQDFSIELLFLIISFLVIMSYLEILDYEMSQPDVLLIVSICIILIMVNIFSINLFNRIRKDNIAESEKQLIFTNNKIIHDIYQIQLENYRKNEQLLHDIKAHLYVSNNLSNKDHGDTNYNEKILNWIEEQKIYVNDTVIQILLVDFAKKCKSSNFQLDINIKQDVSFSSISDFEKVTIFSNILNNAYKAVYESNQNEKAISLVIRQFNNSIIIDLKNTIGNTIPEFDIVNNVGLGTGLKNVKSTIESLNGSMEITTENNIFDITLFVPIGD